MRGAPRQICKLLIMRLQAADISQTLPPGGLGQASLHNSAVLGATVAARSVHRAAALARPLSHVQARYFAAAAAASQQVSSFSTLDMQPAEGRLVEYKRNMRTGLALLLHPDGKQNWSAIDTRKNTFSLKPAQLSFFLPGAGYTEEDLQRVQQLSDSSTDYELLQLAWEVSDGNERYSVAQMADLLFGAQEPYHCYAAHRMLSEDRILFKQVTRQPPQFQPRPKQEAMQLQKKADDIAQREQLLKDLGAKLREARAAAQTAKPAAATWEGSFAPFLSALKAFALTRASEPELTLANQALQLVGADSTNGAAAALLREIGAWGPHMHPATLAYQEQAHFSSEIEAAAQALAASPPPDPDQHTRLDLRHHQVITIDASSTTEVDDGLSVEHRAGLLPRLWVHIADPSRWVQPQSLLDQAAAARATSVYLPAGAVFMFPKVLAAGAFSLQAGTDSCAMSISAVLQPDGSLQDPLISPSRVRVAQRMTYEEVDDCLAEQQQQQQQQHPNAADLQILHQAALARAAWREAQGAINIDRLDSDVRVDNPESWDARISFLPETTGPSRSLVAEMMIMAGEIAACLGRDAGMAMPFRGQSAPVVPTAEELAALPQGPCRAVALRSRMMRSVTTFAQPQPHASLGLPAYLQFTSPIRRYVDLLSHYQMKEYLRSQQPLFTPEDFGERADLAAGIAREASSVERSVKGYWTAVYFARERAANPRKVWRALLLRWQRVEWGQASILLQDPNIETTAHIEFPANAGDLVGVKLDTVDVAGGTVQFKATEIIEPYEPSQQEQPEQAACA